MSKTLTLKDRIGGWSDYGAFVNAMAVLAAGKQMDKAMLWLMLSNRVEVEAQAHEGNGREPLAIELSNAEAKVLWKNLRRLPPDAYGRDGLNRPIVPHTPTLYTMLSEWAAELGGEMPAVELDEDEEDG